MLQCRTTHFQGLLLRISAYGFATRRVNHTSFDNGPIINRQGIIQKPINYLFVFFSAVCVSVIYFGSGNLYPQLISMLFGPCFFLVLPRSDGNKFHVNEIVYMQSVGIYSCPDIRNRKEKLDLSDYWRFVVSYLTNRIVMTGCYS